MIIDSERDQSLRMAIEENDLDALLAWTVEDVLLMAGRQPYTGLSICLYCRESQPIIFVPECEPPESLPSGFTTVIHNWSSGCERKRVADFATELEKNLTSARAIRVGISELMGRNALPGNGSETPPISAEALREVLSLIPSLQIVNAGRLFGGLRLRKTAREIQRIRCANQIALKGIEAFRQKLEPGRTEVEIAGFVESAIHAESGRNGCQSARAWAYVQSGPNSRFAGTYSRSSARNLERADVVVLELGTCVDGFWSDLTRTEFVSEAQPEHLRLFEHLKDAQMAAIGVISPGVSCESVDAAARRVLAAHGLADFFPHATGHHVGFRYHDDGPTFEAGNRECLEPGMVVTIEPGIYGEALGFGMRIEDNAIVLEQGCELLSK